MQTEITQVLTSKDKNKFINFPHHLYADDPNYVPELNISVRERLNKKRNPFFEHSEAELFLAYQGKKVVGRIAAIRNNNYNKYHHSNIGFFGFFDVINDYLVAQKLFQKVYEWSKSQGFDKLLGPTNFSTNETAGLLIRGFNRPPVVQMTYNKPYYIDLLDRFGFIKEMDLYAYRLNRKTINEKSIRLSGIIQNRLQKQNIVFRNVTMKSFNDDVKEIKRIYINAWEKNWGFVPPTTKEFDHLAKELKLVADLQYCYIAELDGKMIGFAVAIPNINEILINIKRGKLFPLGIFKLIFGKRKVKFLRIILLGVVEEYRKKGIEAVFYANYITDGEKNKIYDAEISWILENNDMMRKASENFNGELYKTYRIYGIPIT